MRRRVRLSGAEVQEGQAEFLHLPVCVQEATVAEQFQDGLPHVLAGQCVDDGVEEGVEHSDAQEVICLEEHLAAFDLTAEVQQEQDEQGRPTRNEHPQDYGDGFQEGYVLLRLAVETLALGNRGEALSVGLHYAEDSHVQHHDGHEDGTEDGDAEEDVAFGVQRQDGGAFLQLVDAVPAQDRKDAEKHRQHPAGSNQSKHPTLLVTLVRLHPHHGDVALYGDGQQADDGST